MVEYPSELIRGILRYDQSYILNGKPRQTVFLEGFEKLRGRYELSINWRENEDALEILKKMIHPKKGGPLYECAIVLKTDSLEMIKNTEQLRNKFGYEYDRTPTNPYHGNLLMPEDATKEDLTMLSFMLLACHNEIIRF